MQVTRGGHSVFGQFADLNQHSKTATIDFYTAHVKQKQLHGNPEKQSETHGLLSGRHP